MVANCGFTLNRNGTRIPTKTIADNTTWSETVIRYNYPWFLFPVPVLVPVNVNTPLPRATSTSIHILVTAFITPKISPISTPANPSSDFKSHLFLLQVNSGQVRWITQFRNRAETCWFADIFKYLTRTKHQFIIVSSGAYFFFPWTVRHKPAVFLRFVVLVLCFLWTSSLHQIWRFVAYMKLIQHQRFQCFNNTINILHATLNCFHW